ncbi:MAG: cupredoxin domain-containing protein [Nanoarchaeota archaeon]|nr:cupredoxin domain-containing protein [Nanoarchaeota archaeon]
MKSIALFGVIVVLVLIVGGFVFLKSGNSAGAAGTVIGNSGAGEVQKITLSMKNSNYYPNTIRVKAGQPVSITLDSSIGGCFRSFNIRDLGVQAYSKNPSQTIDFTPTQKGTYRFACSMGMGYGTIIVE